MSVPAGFQHIAGLGHETYFCNTIGCNGHSLDEARKVAAVSAFAGLERPSCIASLDFAAAVVERIEALEGR